MAYPFSMGANAATIIAQICTYNGKLPQGACTSPIISNLITLQLDNRLTHIAKKYLCTYSRYADDITFSSNKSMLNTLIYYDKDNKSTPHKLELSNTLKNAITDSGFKINYKKVRLETKQMRQEVTGITVNKFPNVKRKYIKEIRAMLHSWEKIGLIDAEKKHLLSKKDKKDMLSKNTGNYFKNVIIGKLAYLKMVRGKDNFILRKLSLKFAELETNKLPKFIKEIKMSYEEFEVFICHASEDKENIARPLYDELIKLDIKTFLDEKYIDWGDSLTEKINNALGSSKYVITILSLNSITKKWPLKEIQSTLAFDITKEKKLLPILAGKEKIIYKKLPLLKDKLYKKWDNNAEELAYDIKRMLNGEQTYKQNIKNKKIFSIKDIAKNMINFIFHNTKKGI